MATAVDELVRRPGAWLAAGGDTAIVISSRVRLARNLSGVPFPAWAKEPDCIRAWNDLVPVLSALPCLSAPLVLSMADLGLVDRLVLRERHLISIEMSEKGKGCGVVMRHDETVAIMVNEEDHLRLQAMRPGLQVQSLWEEIDAIDTQVEERVRFAFSPQLGYLTACPTNVGTGLRASVMLHLPGLRLINEIDPVIKGLSKVGLAVRGLLGEGTEAFGNMFQISNQTTLGESEDAIIRRLIQIVGEVVDHERNARARLQEQKPDVVMDRVGRAYGVLCHAHVLTSGEALDLLSALRLGVELGLIRNLDTPAINELMVLTQPGHLQKIEGVELEAGQRDIVRARIMRQSIQPRVTLG